MKTKTWQLQWGNPTPHGHSYEAPIERGFPTKKAALERKKKLLSCAD